MSRRRSSVCAAFVGLAFALLGGRVLAAEPVHLIYRAPDTCPNESTFLDAVRARTAEAEFVEGAAKAPRTFIVTLASNSSGYTGQLEVRGTEAASTERHFEAADCAQLASALALLTALAIDPNASSPEPPVTLAPPRIPPPRAATPPTRWRFASGMAVSLETGLAPVIIVAPQVFGEAALDARGPWSPAFRVAFTYGETGLFGPSSASAKYRWGAVRAEACPLRIAGKAIELRPCAVTDVGALWARGTSIAVQTSATQPWFAAGLALRSRWSPTRWLFVELGAGGLLPVTRPTFVFTGPRDVVHGTPPAMAMGTVSLGLSFP